MGSERSFSGKPFYLPGLDGLRLVAWFLVFFTHVASTFLPHDLAPRIFSIIFAGSYGVSIFFALSSFLITSLLMQEREDTEKVHVGGFYLRRILRIWPLYFLIVIISYLIQPFGRPWPPDSYGLLRWATFTGNFGLVAGLFFPFSISPMWSVCVEEQFYLCWPWLVKFSNKNGLTVVAVLMIAVGLWYRVSNAQQGLYTDHNWSHTFTHLDCFGFGCLGALYREKFKVASPYLWIVASLAGIFVLESAFHFKFYIGTETVAGALSYTAIAACCAVMVVMAAQVRSGLLTESWMISGGRISYGLYAFHGTFLYLCNGALQGLDVGVKLAIVIGGTFACAIISFMVLETPFLRLKAKKQVVVSGYPISESS